MMDGERRPDSIDKVKVSFFIITSEPARLARHSHQSNGSALDGLRIQCEIGSGIFGRYPFIKPPLPNSA